MWAEGQNWDTIDPLFKKKMDLHYYVHSHDFCAGRCRYEHRSFLHRSVPFHPQFLLCSFLAILRASFIKLLRSKGAAAARGCLGSRRFDLWPECCGTLPSIYSQFTKAIRAKAERRGRVQRRSTSGIAAAGPSSWNKRGGSRFHGPTAISIWGIKAFHIDSYSLFRGGFS